MAGQDCNNKNGEEHQDTSLPQADQSSTDCQEEYQSADYDNTNYTLSGAGIMEILTNSYDNPSECIRIWLKEIEKDGFHIFPIKYDALEKFHNKNNEDFELDTEEQFCVEDPFSEVSPQDIERYEREDGQSPNVGLKGNCTIFLNNGFELSGRWRNNRRTGPGLICGKALEKMGIKSIWGKYKDGFLSGLGKAILLEGDCTLEGQFVGGKLHGPVRGLTSRGRLAWVGLFKNGRPYGASWRGVEGGAFMYGNVGSKGLFGGPKNAFIYPDMETALYGSFHKGRMVEAYPVTVKEAYLDKTHSILRLRFSKPKYQAPVFKYWPSGLDYVSVPPLQEDPYESKYVKAKSSSMSDNAGDGLYLKRDVKANTTIAFYNGIRCKPGEEAPFCNTGYQIFVDWNKKSEITSDYMDIPPEYVSLKRYKASLGHKINHSFDPNCRWGTINHPTFGRVPRVVTLKDIKAGEELSCHYMIDMQEAADNLDHLQWYVDLWDDFSRGNSTTKMDESEDDISN